MSKKQKNTKGNENMDYEERKKYASDVYNRNATKTEDRISRNSNTRRTASHAANRKNNVKIPKRDYYVPSSGDTETRRNDFNRREATNRKISKRTFRNKIFSGIGKVLATISVTILAIFLTLVMMIFLICHGPSEKATELFTTTFLETGQMKFIVSIFLSNDRIQEIVAKNSMSEMTAEVDTNLIKIEEAPKEDNSQDVELVQISGNTFSAKMLIIKDPSRVKVATTYPWGEYGVELDKLVKNSGSVAGVNGGLYVSDSNKGGKPLGLVVCDGQIQYNNPTGYAGLHLIGFDESNILRIISLEGMNASQVEKLVKDEKIRDAVVFQEESSDKNNHFVKLVVNGEGRQMNGSGSGANPRTVIGQRKDGAVLLLVTDGRGASGHLGATASDLIDIMLEYGAVNAANLDGGSSSSMYYNDNYEMTSVTLYYSNSSWKLPTAFVVK